MSETGQGLRPAPPVIISSPLACGTPDAAGAAYRGGENDENILAALR